MVLLVRVSGVPLSECATASWVVAMRAASAVAMLIRCRMYVNPRGLTLV